VNSHPVTSSVKFRTSVGATPKLSVIAGVAVALTICLPLASVVWLAFFPEENIWPHLVSTVLTRYVMNTVALMAGVAFGTLIIGVGTAWMVTHYEFTGRSHLVWALLLPFAVPAYVIAYVYTDLLEFSGPLQSLLRDIFGWQSARDYYFPRIRSLGGAMCMMILVLYPYVYLLARSAFVEQSASLFEAAKILGKSRRSSFFAISLPMARPAIAIGVAMALMETVNDYGTVDYFAVPTLAAGLFDVWQGMNNLGGAAQISCLILVFVLFLIMLERLSRKHQKLGLAPLPHVSVNLNGLA
jgi:iron(III) transport system permease protein